MYEFMYAYIREFTDAHKLHLSCKRNESSIAANICYFSLCLMHSPNPRSQACLQDVPCLIHASISLMTEFCNRKGGLYCGALSAIDMYMRHHG